MIHQTKSHNIVIVGGGMVGLSAAIACAQNGLKVAIIEKNPAEKVASEANNYSPRVSAINHASQRFLKNIGAWKHLPLKRIQPYSAMSVWDSLGSGEILFDAQTVQKSHIGHIIENAFIVDALWQRVHTLANIDLYLGQTIESWTQNDKTVNIVLSNAETLSAEVLIGCEGKNSVIREQSGIKKWQWDYQHTAVVTTVKHQQRHGEIARQVFLDTGPLAFLPLANEDKQQQYSSIVWSAKTAQAEKILSYTDDEFSRAINQAFEHKLGPILEVNPRFSFPLTAHQSQTYFQGRAILLGDAAHAIHPLAGLGVNLGFLDAATLAQELSNAYQNKIDIAHPHTLRRFQRQRQSHNLAVAALMETFKRLYDTQAAVPVLARNIGMNVLNSSILMKRPIISAALGDFSTPLPELCR